MMSDGNGNMPTAGPNNKDTIMKDTAGKRRIIIIVGVAVILGLGAIAGIAAGVVVTQQRRRAEAARIQASLLNNSPTTTISVSNNVSLISSISASSSIADTSTTTTSSTSSMSSNSADASTTTTSSTSSMSSNSADASTTTTSSISSMSSNSADASTTTASSTSSMISNSADASTTTTSSVVEPTVSCPVIVRGVCYKDLASGVQAARDGDQVTVVQNVNVYTPIPVRQSSLTFKGRNNALVTSWLKDNIHGAILNLLAQKEQTITLLDMRFNHRGRYGSVLRTPSLGDATPAPPEPKYKMVHLTMERCFVKGFRTGARGGGAIFIGLAGKIKISESQFTDNSCAVPPGMRLRWESGGGAIWIRVQALAMQIINSQFIGNVHEFAHGGGGGIFIADQSYDDSSEGTVYVDKKSVFEHNKAASGGAFTILNNYANVEMAGNFRHNVAYAPAGWNGRSGASWIQFVHSNCSFSGTFYNNTALKAQAEETSIRGATLTANIIHKGGRVMLSGDFTENTCPDKPSTGMVWEGASPSGSLRSGGEIIVSYEAIFEDNGLPDSPIINLTPKEGRKRFTFRPAQWAKYKKDHIVDRADYVIKGEDLE